ncbi:MAG: cupin domain-containing protein [Burkholderiales bacterium]|nr:cupin domain-containing protein [Nitrosomonas sp.]MCP5274404.1 cupin domain-containing protein [Burkholderiales bacterium]
MAPENIFSANHVDPEKAEKEVFDVLVSSTAVSIERIISKGHRSPASGWYDQEKNEWVLLLRGRAELTFQDQTTVRLEEGDFIHLPPHKKHRVSWTDPDKETFWLAVHY